MKYIDISTPKHPSMFAMVDDFDHKELSKHKWCAHDGGSGKLYTVRGCSVNGEKKTVILHEVIMGRREGMQIDHKNGNTLDNQRHNLRHCTQTENNRNRKICTRNTSGYKGASWYKKEKKWRSRIRFNGREIHLGYFTCLIKAARCYDTAAIKYHGEFARLNFPKCQ